MIVFDAGSTHGNDFNKIRELVDLCLMIGPKDRGEWKSWAALKFQLFDKSPGNLVLDRGLFKDAVAYANCAGVEVFASVWSTKDIDLLVDCDCKYIKIAYSQRNNTDLIRYAIETGLQVIVSYGIMDTIRHNVYPLYCIPEYPVLYTPNFEGVWERGFIGYSDHTLGVDQAVHAIGSYRRACIGAEFVLEKHVRPEHPYECLDAKFALSPKEARMLYGTAAR